jgi:hypothetical protein
VYQGTQASCVAGAWVAGSGSCAAVEAETFAVWLDALGQIWRAPLAEEAAGGAAPLWLHNTTRNASGAHAPFALDAPRRTVYWTDHEADTIVAALLPEGGGTLAGAGGWLRAVHRLLRGGAAAVSGLAAHDGLLVWSCADLSACGGVGSAGLES